MHTNIALPKFHLAILTKSIKIILILENGGAHPWIERLGVVRDVWLHLNYIESSIPKGRHQRVLVHHAF